MKRIAHNSLSSEQNVWSLGRRSNRWIERLKALCEWAIRGVGGGIVVSLGFVAMVLAVSPRIAAAQSSSACAWPFEITLHGAGNFAWPDTTARYWLTAFDSQYVQMTIHGTYPTARYMSFVTYDGEVPTAVDDRIYDAEIKPDRSDSNPFVPPGGGGTYTVTVIRGQSPGGNVIGTAPGFAWVAYRVYLPDEGENSMGGVPLPSVTLTDQNGGTETLPPCAEVNVYSGLSALLNELYPFAAGVPTTISPDRLWFAPPNQPPPPLFPNPDNKYISSISAGIYQPGRIIVVRGKAPSFPDTYSGFPVWRPARRFKAVQLRYWSLCVNDYPAPFPAVQCMTDLNARLDRHRFYTVVISDDQLAPSWLPAKVNWLPWGDEQMGKAIFFRNMLPAADFPYSIQNAIADDCTYPFNFPHPPDPVDVEQAGHCAQSIMGDYYPIAVWCNKSIFRRKGWRGCFRAAGVPVAAQ
jgi:hypothetical protein